MLLLRSVAALPRRLPRARFAPAAAQPVGARAFAQSVSAALVKQLRQRTGAPINKCKQALEAESGDLEAAATWLRKSGIATAQKKASRGANDGVVGVHAAPSLDRVALIELNSETDFVARNESFQSLARAVAAAVLDVPSAAEAAVAELPLSAVLAAQVEYEGRSQSVEEAIVSGVAALGTRAARNLQSARVTRAACDPLAPFSSPGARLSADSSTPRAAARHATGENLQLRRACTARLTPGVAGVIARYVHNAYVPGLGRTVAAVVLEAPGLSTGAGGEDERATLEAISELGQKLAMHVVAAAPQYLSRASVPAARVAEEAEIIRSQLAGSNKGADVLEKIASGKLGKFYEEACLLEQSYALGDAGKVGQLVAARAKELGTHIEVKGFARYHLGSAADAAQ